MKPVKRLKKILSPIYTGEQIRHVYRVILAFDSIFYM